MVELFISVLRYRHSPGDVQLGRVLLALGLSHLTEAVSELPADESQVPRSTSAGGLPPLGLHRPAEAPDLGGGESAGGTDLLLDVECHLATPPTQSVGLVASFPKELVPLVMTEDYFFSCRSESSNI